MRAMVLAAGLGTRLRPLTYEIPKPMVPVLDRPVMAHIVDHLKAQGFDQLIANLHYFRDSIEEYFGQELKYSYEPELLGTAGGVRNCREFLTEEGGSFLVISGDALSDIDLQAFVGAHNNSGAVATLAAKRVAATSEYGVILTDGSNRITGFQEKPEPGEELSDLANCGIYLFRPEIFDYFPEKPFVDWAHDVFPALLDDGAPFHVHDIGNDYWNDVGSLDELKAGTLDVLAGNLRLQSLKQQPPVELREGWDGPIWIGQDVRIGKDVRITGPVVIGDRSSIGDGAAIRSSILLPGSEVADNGIVIDALIGHTKIRRCLSPRTSGQPSPDLIADAFH